MVRIRPAGPDDATGIRRVAVAAYNETYVDVVDKDGVERLLDGWYDEFDLRRRLDEGDGRWFVAVDDAANETQAEETVGYATADVADDGTGVLATLYVHPDRWSEGIGTRLYDHARDHVAERGADSLRVRVFADNDVGRSFYADRADLIAEREERLEPLDSEVATAVYEASVE